MNIITIAIGSELLAGKILNRNAWWIHSFLDQHGYPVRESRVLPDEHDQLLASFRQIREQADVVITTGGLGPTSDDLTLPVVAELFEQELVEDETHRVHVEEFFRSRGRTMTQSNRGQWLRLEQGEVVPNPLGTAAGILMERQGKLWFSLPGVPFEMKRMMAETVLPRIRTLFDGRDQVRLRYRLAGVAESSLYDYLRERIDLKALGTVAFLPSLLGHRLDVEPAGDPAEADRRLRELLSSWLVSASGLSLPEALVQNLTRLGKTLTAAESCTGGQFGQTITAVPGASQVYAGGQIVYSNGRKTDWLQVPTETLAAEGAVSEAVVVQMAQEIRRQTAADFALAVSGIAGPDGGTPEKPVGTTWIALASEQGVTARLHQLRWDREQNRTHAVGLMLTELFQHLRDRELWHVE